MIVKSLIASDDLAQLPITMTITMPYGEWMRLKDSLNNNNYPGVTLWRYIDSTLDKIKQEFIHYIRDPDE